tara:strand:+ start:145 stop:321 length:177 start_codon:yes stop_codon:yes gene_type:complete
MKERFKMNDEYWEYLTHTLTNLHTSYSDARGKNSLKTSMHETTNMIDVINTIESYKGK